MSSVYTSFSEHLQRLPAERAQHGAALRETVERHVRRPSNADLSGFLFLPDQTDHPDHNDAAEVFAQAVEQMVLPAPWVGDEIPLLFVGYHAMNRLTGRRTAQGLLLSDQAMYVQDDFTMLSSTPPPAQGHALPAAPQDVAAFVSTLLARFKAWKDWATVADMNEAFMQNRWSVVLEPVVDAVVSYHAQHASRREAPQRVWTLAEVVAGYGAADTLLDPANPKLAKKLGKVTDKFGIGAQETLQWALVDFPLFGGPYGLALTTQALIGKDLMEDPVRIPLDTVDARTLRFSDKGDELVAGSHPPLTVPAHLKDALRAPFLELLKQEVVRLQSRG